MVSDECLLKEGSGRTHMLVFVVSRSLPSHRSSPLSFLLPSLTSTWNNTIGLVTYFVGFCFPRMFSLTKNESRRWQTIRYRRSLSHERLELGGR